MGTSTFLRPRRAFTDHTALFNWETTESDKLLPDMTTIKNTLASPLAEIGALLKERRSTIDETPVLQLLKGKSNTSVLGWFRQKAAQIGSQSGGGSGESSDVAPTADLLGSNSSVAPVGVPNPSECLVEATLEEDLPGSRRVTSFEAVLDDQDAEDNIVFNARRPKAKKSSLSANLSVPPKSSSPTSKGSSPVPTYEEVFSLRTSPFGAGTSQKSDPPPPYDIPDDVPDDKVVSQILTRFGQLKRTGSTTHVPSQPSPHSINTDDPDDSADMDASEASQSSSLSISSESNSAAGEPEQPATETPIEDIYRRREGTVDSLESAPDTDLQCNTVPDVTILGIAEPRFPQYDFHWSQVKGPGPVVSLAACDGYLCCVDSRDVVYHSKLWGREFTWKKGARPANRVALSPSGQALWVLYREKLYAARLPSKSEPVASNWVEVAGDVASVGVTETTAW